MKTTRTGAPRWPRKGPTRRRMGPGHRLWRRVFSPVFYLKLVMVVAGLGVIILPYGTDVVNAALKPVKTDMGRCRVLTVIDGDTVRLWCAATGVETARIKGYDSPEKFSPRCVAELVAAEKATWALRLLIFEAKTVTLRRAGTDRYRRTLIELRLDGRDVARAMIAARHGRGYGGGLRATWC